MFKASNRLFPPAIGLLMLIAGSPAVAAAPAGEIATVAEAARTPDFPGADVDSAAVWRDGKGGAWLLITAKEGNCVYVCDAITGKRIKVVGATGDGPGQMRRPNGIAVVGDWMFVVERDNRRVQVFSLPACESLLTFGQEDLRKPYGIAAFAPEKGRVELYITDDYDVRPDPASDLTGALPQLGERVRRYRLIAREGQPLQARLVGTFGETTDPAGALGKVETILADPANERLYICDELTKSAKIYNLAGEFLKASVGDGAIIDDPEGLAIDTSPGLPGGGVLVMTDQGPEQTRWRIFALDGLRLLGSVTGDPNLANTDGVALTVGDLGPLRGGALYACHDDLRFQCYAWADVLAAVGIEPARDSSADASPAGGGAK
jgi:3-phytase